MGNDEELASFGRIVKLAKIKEPKPDPHGVEAGALWAGAHLKRCFPELFSKQAEE